MECVGGGVMGLAGREIYIPIKILRNSKLMATVCWGGVADREIYNPHQPFSSVSLECQAVGFITDEIYNPHQNF